MSALIALVIHMGVAQAQSWQVEPARPRVGDHVVVTTSLPVRDGASVRFARPCDVDPAFARVEPELAPASGAHDATLKIAMVAAAPGRFHLGPFALRVD